MKTGPGNRNQDLPSVSYGARMDNWKVWKVCTSIDVLALSRPGSIWPVLVLVLVVKEEFYLIVVW